MSMYVSVIKQTNNIQYKTFYNNNTLRIMSKPFNDKYIEKTHLNYYKIERESNALRKTDFETTK